VKVTNYWWTKYLQCWMLNTYFFDVELLCFWVGPINLEPNISRRIWYTMWCCDALSCVTTSLAASGLTFRSCMPNGGIELRAHPTQLRVTCHRVGCDDTQKRWVWPRYLYFWGLGWKNKGFQEVNSTFQSISSGALRFAPFYVPKIQDYPFFTTTASLLDHLKFTKQTNQQNIKTSIAIDSAGSFHLLPALLYCFTLCSTQIHSTLYNAV
jgi:hypothetical protein